MVIPSSPMYLLVLNMYTESAAFKYFARQLIKRQDKKNSHRWNTSPPKLHEIRWTEHIEEMFYFINSFVIQYSSIAVAWRPVRNIEN